jgi:short-subunit dehydrogenase involved in D-alanine esterification of teichoic acids
LRKYAYTRYGKVDAVVNNATTYNTGPVDESSIDEWDNSYKVHVRGPVLLAKIFLPDMKKRSHGVFLSLSSSMVRPNMGTYESLKAAQTELTKTIAQEIRGKGVYVYAINPGFVRTNAMIDAESKVAELMGQSLEQLVETWHNTELTVDAAGAAVAASIALASKYNGQTVNAKQVLRDIGIIIDEDQIEASDHFKIVAGSMLEKIRETYKEQIETMKRSNILERQRYNRDFKKNTGMSIEEATNALTGLAKGIEYGKVQPESLKILAGLKNYLVQQAEQAKVSIKDDYKQNTILNNINSSIRDIESLIQFLNWEG